MGLTRGRLVRRSVWFHRAIGVSVALGVAAATAVVCGALLVGDSMRGSLRELTLERLGGIDGVVAPGTFFGPQPIVDSLADTSSLVVPAILFERGIIESNPVGSGNPESPVRTRRSGNVQIVAVSPEFWRFDTAGVTPDAFPGEDSVVLNQSVADTIGARVGDLVTIRLPKEQAVPADSPLGRRDADSEGLPRLKVVAIVPDRGLGRFSLQPSQVSPLCAFLSIELVQEVLDRQGQANTLLIDVEGEPDEAMVARLDNEFQPRLADYGLTLSHVQNVFDEGQQAETVFDYFQLTSDRLLLDSRVVEEVTQAFADVRPEVMLTYLANAIETTDGKRVVTYSTITAVPESGLLPVDFRTDDSESQSRNANGAIPVSINSWTSEQLSINVGDPLRVYYYEPETTEGREVEKSFDAVVTQIAPLTKPKTPYRRSRPAVFDMRPTVFNDPDMTPTVPGVTDQDSINDWDLPFRLEREVSKEDDAYWNDYRLTPKLFLPFSVGVEKFGSRFGDATSIRFDRDRFPGSNETVESLSSRLEISLDAVKESLGFAVIPIRSRQLAASRGTTPFDALFLSLSFFVIFAALMLVTLLFRLGMEQRATEYGTLLAIGMDGNSVARLALNEGLLLAVPGACIGIGAAVLYAKFILWALAHWWVGAVTVPFLKFHWTPASLLIGGVAGVLMAGLTILITARRLRKTEVRPLLSGRIPEKPNKPGRYSWFRWCSLAAFIAALVLGVSATFLSGPAQGGAFVGGGMMLLIACLLAAYSQLSHWHRARETDHLGGRYSLRTLALRSVGRNPLRSTLSMGLMAIACFLIVSMSAFQLRPTAQGVGGFDLLGTTAVPIYKDLGDIEVRRSQFGSDAQKVEDSRAFGLRYRPGQDASCNNLYQATQPQVLGMSEKLVQWYRNSPADQSFVWASHGPRELDSKSNGASEEMAWTPWQLLQTPASGTVDDPVPVVLDQNTAMWSLQMRGGVGEIKAFTFDDGGERYFRVVGLLGGSVLQGSLIVSDENFQRLFPEINGYSYFFIRAGEQVSVEETKSIYEDRLGDNGLDLQSSKTVLANLLAVQNTYLRTFQSLGALGLLLGTLGLGVVQLRNVLERRGELSLMRALGFSRFRLAITVMIENLVLLLGGILFGAGTAFVAVVPYWLLSGTPLGFTNSIAMLSLVFAVGFVSGFFAIRRVWKMNLLSGLTS